MQIETDILVVGTGLAGLTYAIRSVERARELGLELPRVTVLAKLAPDQTNTAWAQGGVASVTSPEDSFASHERDTFVAGGGLCWDAAVRACVEDGPARMEELESYGVRFTRRTDTGEWQPTPEDTVEYDLTREGGHSKRRILHVDDMTGWALQRALLERAKAEPAITILDHHHAIDLVTTWKLGMYGPNTVVGAYALDVARNAVVAIRARVTCLATGGAGKVYLYTSNPDVACGEGIAMAYRAGASVANMEFYQFHPTCLFHPQAKSFLISEALRGEGGVLKRLDGTAFMAGYHERKDLAPRDIVARAIDAEMKRTGDPHVVLDMRHIDAEFLRRRFPNIHRECLKWGIDMTERPIPVVPAAHYCCGGVLTDLHGESDVTNLFVCGEASSTGLHGANRLASNSLLECVVFGSRAADRTIARLHEVAAPPEFPRWDSGNATEPDELVVLSQSWDELRRLMWNYVGIVRSDKRLERARHRIELLQEEIQEFYWDFLVSAPLIEMRAIATVAELIVACARARRERRGLHYSMDVEEPGPETVPSDTIVKRQFHRMHVEVRPVAERVRSFAG